MDYYSVWVGVGLGTTLLDSIQVHSDYTGPGIWNNYPI